jgi:hypothetical protein
MNVPNRSKKYCVPLLLSMALPCLKDRKKYGNSQAAKQKIEKWSYLKFSSCNTGNEEWALSYQITENMIDRVDHLSSGKIYAKNQK